jgi:hypothetical protein
MLEKSEGHTHVLPQEDTSASLAIIAKHLLKKSEGGTHSPYEDTRASCARKISASHMLKQSEGKNNHRVRDVDVSIHPLSWSLPLVTMSVAPSIFSLPPTNPNKRTQHNLRHDTPRPLNPQPTLAPSRFASPNRFEVLSAPDLSPPLPLLFEPPWPSPHPPQILSSILTPLIADTGCTGLLL